MQSNEQPNSDSEDLHFDDEDDEDEVSEFDYEDSQNSFSSLICSTNEYLKFEEQKNAKALVGLDLNVKSGMDDTSSPMKALDFSSPDRSPAKLSMDKNNENAQTG